MNREQILRELGLGPVWLLRSRQRERMKAARQQSIAQAAQTASTRTVTPLPPAPAPQIAARLPQPISPRSAAALSALSPLPDVSALDWAALTAAIHACRACDLCRQRRQAVPGVGDRQAQWLFVGEAPGAEEDERGEPFVGQSGKLLDNMLKAIDLARGQNVSIANAVKCRPPANRTPEAAELATCRPFLQRQIALLQPKIIVALGRPAAQTLLQSEVKISALRGQALDHHGAKLIVTYHPSYLLRTPLDKAKAWEDLLLAKRTAAECGVRSSRG